jgi:hypothetical protein
MAGVERSMDDLQGAENLSGHGGGLARRRRLTRAVDSDDERFCGVRRLGYYRGRTTITGALA